MIISGMGLIGGVSHKDDPEYEFDLKASSGAWFNEHEYDKAGNLNRLDLYGHRYQGPC